MIHPYFELFQELSREPSVSDDLQLRLRKKLIWAYSWAIASPEALRAIRDVGVPIVEIGAGTGYWAWLLSQAGLSVRAYDREPDQSPRWFDVKKGGAEVLTQYPSSALFLCWPPLDEPLAEDSLNAHQGEWVFYVGEEGRTASRGFHERLKEQYTLIQTIPLPRWPGFRDSLFIFRK